MYLPSAISLKQNLTLMGANISTGFVVDDGDRDDRETRIATWRKASLRWGEPAAAREEGNNRITIVFADRSLDCRVESRCCLWEKSAETLPGGLNVTTWR